MTRPTDPRGANRRAPTAFGDEIGLDVPNDAPVKRRRWLLPERRIIPDCGCRMYLRSNGVVYTRCEAHRPAGSQDLGPVRGQCVACAAEGV